MPEITADSTDRKAVVNFTKPSFARHCQRSVVTSGFPAQVMPSIIQGTEGNIAVRDHMIWAQQLLESDSFMMQAASDPSMMQAPAPYEQAVSRAPKVKPPRVAKEMSLKEANPQFHKTKMCMFYQKNRCAMGDQCVFAHHKQELSDQPDLLKTKLCYNFLRGRCENNPCNYAHGNNELRNGDSRNKTKVYHGGRVEKKRQYKSEASTTDSDGKTTPSGTDEGKLEDLLFPPGLLFE
jgi:hypothetical protein